MPAFAERLLHAEEMMDDFSIVDDRLTRALDNLRLVNRYLGGYAVVQQALAPLLAAHGGRTLRLLDLATGVADYPEMVVRWADRMGVQMEVLAIDANPATVDYARQVLDRNLPAALRRRIRVEVGDALALPYDEGAFDVCTASHFMHHLVHEEAVALVRAMQRVSRHGLIVNDLHRHPLAYYGIVLLGALLPVSPMFRNDGPLSVLRSFTRNDLRAIADAAGLSAYTVRWHWAFRWMLTTTFNDV